MAISEIVLRVFFSFSSMAKWDILRRPQMASIFLPSVLLSKNDHVAKKNRQVGSSSIVYFNSVRRWYWKEKFVEFRVELNRNEFPLICSKLFFQWYAKLSMLLFWCGSLLGCLTQRCLRSMIVMHEKNLYATIMA